MNDLPRQKLCELIAQHGPGLCEDARRCKALLKEACGSYKQEIRVLVDVLTEDTILDELRKAPPDAPREELLARLTRQLREATDLPEDEARWGVESWALALGALSAAGAESGPADAKGCRPATTQARSASAGTSLPLAGASGLSATASAGSPATTRPRCCGSSPSAAVTPTGRASASGWTRCSGGSGWSR